jgi:hypothetical protein
MAEVLTSVATQDSGCVCAKSSFCYLDTYMVDRDNDIYNQELKKSYGW